jgi:glycosyltransferase involved in cell wall biosynthesis
MKLIIVGDGIDRQELEKLAEGLNVEFVGQKPAHEARRIVAESKALVSPSACWETFGLAAAEAMTVGVPSVVSNVGALPDVVQDGRFGEVFEAGNVEACATAIKRLLSRPDYDEMCVAARHEAEAKYSEEANYQQLLEIYMGLGD